MAIPKRQFAYAPFMITHKHAFERPAEDAPKFMSPLMFMLRNDVMDLFTSWTYSRTGS